MTKQTLIAGSDDCVGAHTPGPWATDPEVGHEMVLGSDGKMVADCSIFARRKNEVATNRANARLIAAAPDLLAFAKAHDTYMSKHYSDGPDSSALHRDAAANWKLCRAALAAAKTGGA